MTDFPPLPSVFALHPVPPGTDPLAAAMAMAPAQGAGTLAWQDGEDSLWAAVVLEPELPLATARIALLAAAAAAADALVVLGPPEIPVTLRWPATLVVNGGAVGTALLAVPPGCGTMGKAKLRCKRWRTWSSSAVGVGKDSVAK